MVYAFEVIGLIFTAIMIYFTYLEFQRKKLTKLGLIFWDLIWIIGISLILFHSSVNKILPTLNLVRALDLYMILAFMFLFGIIFYLFLLIKKAESRVEQLTRAIALKPIKEMKNKE